MKRIASILVMLMLLSISVAAQQHKGIDIQVNRLEEKSGSVFLKYTITTDKRNISNCESVFTNLYLKKGDHTVFFDPIAINGKLRKNNFKRQAALQGKPVGNPAHTYTAGEPGSNVLPFNSDFPYEEWMNGAVLYAKQTVWGCGKNISERDIKLAQLIIPEPEPEPTPEPEPIPEPLPVVKEVFHKEGTAYIDFPIGKSIINVDFGVNRKELAKIGELISEINKDPDAKITGLEITGYASPDGPYAINDRLSRERAQALSEHINTYYRLNLSPAHIYIKNVAEDWEGLTKMIEESNLSQRGELLNIIRTVPSLDERERALMHLGGGNVYRTLKETFFPNLRKTEYKILYQTEE